MDLTKYYHDEMMREEARTSYEELTRDDRKIRSNLGILEDRLPSRKIPEQQQREEIASMLKEIRNFYKSN